ncbi:uncharacterized protein LOC111781356 [Cucurbita pepo subsp. pepo]|uniref:uncharacterized protein LOC111781356 n=1 Tax=Cucurbita pepo subsp. pepo TaxID=3664 RepID=UPI000C9D9476|nr:uncharacterized protein LOC111781356 [Cucurbita pepo subsp. pepo]
MGPQFWFKKGSQVLHKYLKKEWPTLLAIPISNKRDKFLTPNSICSSMGHQGNVPILQWIRWKSRVISSAEVPKSMFILCKMIVDMSYAWNVYQLSALKTWPSYTTKAEKEERFSAKQLILFAPFNLKSLIQ